MRAFPSRLNLDFDLLILNDYWICPDAEAWVGLAFSSFCIVCVAVNGTYSDTVPYPTSAERTHRMRTGIVYSTEFTVFIEDSNSPSVDSKRFSASFSDGGCFRDRCVI